MKIIKKILSLTGFGRNTRYETEFLRESNIRSSAFMGAIIAILEVWLFIRQFDKYVLPDWDTRGFMGILYYSSNFVLFFLVGISIMIYCLLHMSKKASRKKVFVLNLIPALLTFGFSFYGIFENYRDWTTYQGIVANILLIAIYVFAFLISLCIIVDSFFVLAGKKAAFDFGKRGNSLVALWIIFFFAFMCFSFGGLVSFRDYFSSKQKQIICFLTMVLYGAALIIWRPFITVILNTGIFMGFYFLIIHETPRGEPFKDSDFINYITFLISLSAVCVSIYHLRLKEAKKAENLEYLAHHDELTGLESYSYFSKEVKDLVAGDPNVAASRILLFINIGSFKSFNERRGFLEGNRFLLFLSAKLQEIFPDSHVCRPADDHFALYVPVEDWKEKAKQLNQIVHDYDSEISLRVCIGAYAMRSDESVHLSIDRARFACATISDDHSALYAEFDEKMNEGIKRRNYVIRHLDRAIAEGWVRPYYQPVVFSKSRMLCGAEALARWIDPTYGFMSPGLFIPVLESTKLIGKIDACIVECVCKDLRAMIDAGRKPFPVSVNFSRIDFETMDVIALLDEVTKKYGIDKELLHVEVTESALTSTLTNLSLTLHQLKEKGYALWLDDFGSGYSSLNTLKDFDFDVMKIDMKFLEGFDESQKARPLIRSVIKLANDMGMRTLCEGVETQTQTNFLREAGCERLQGYYFDKPIPIEELLRRIDEGDFILAYDVEKDDGRQAGKKASAAAPAPVEEPKTAEEKEPAQPERKAEEAEAKPLSSYPSDKPLSVLFGILDA